MLYRVEKDKKCCLDGINQTKLSKGSEIELDKKVGEYFKGLGILSEVQYKRVDPIENKKVEPIENKKIDSVENKTLEAPKKRGRKPRNLSEQ